MTTRARRRERELISRKLKKRGLEVVDLCQSSHRLGTLKLSGEERERCYARTLGSCSGPMSKEHFISKSILQQLGELDASIFPWLNGRKTGRVSVNDLVANCLCSYHNTFLSPLDSVAGEVFKNFAELASPGAPHIFIWGPSFQRWFLKLLIGLMAAKAITLNGEIIEKNEVPIEWVEILFGLRDFSPGHGLYMTPFVGNQIELGKTFGFGTLYINDNLCGIKVGLGGIWFWLSMVERKQAFKSNHPAYNSIIYQPQGININSTFDRVKIFWE